MVIGPNKDLGSRRSNDTFITSKVKARFVESDKFSPTAVKVVTENGTVYLMGIVTREEGAAARPDRRDDLGSRARRQGLRVHGLRLRVAALRRERPRAMMMAAPVTIPPPRYPAKVAADADALARIAALARPLVFTNGVFDVLHRGHVTYLEQARGLGAALVVAVNSDASVPRRSARATTGRSTASTTGWPCSLRSRRSISSCRSTTTRRAR